jgi:flagellar basal-body rod protein FlgB
MNSDTTVIMIKALDGLSARAVVTAQNIANAATPGYRPLRVSFEQALKDAAAKGPAAVKDVVATATRGRVGTADAELRPDLELATASATSLRYGALIDLLSRQMQLESIAVKGNT